MSERVEIAFGMTSEEIDDSGKGWEDFWLDLPRPENPSIAYIHGWYIGAVRAVHQGPLFNLPEEIRLKVELLRDQEQIEYQRLMKGLHYA